MLLDESALPATSVHRGCDGGHKLQLHPPIHRMTSSRNRTKRFQIPIPSKTKLEGNSNVHPGAKRKTRVLIADRDSISSDLLAHVLGSDRGIEAMAASSSDVLQLIPANRIDVVVIASELQVDAGDGFDLADIVNREFPAVSIVLLLNNSHRDFVLRAFRSGARGIFCREQSMEEFLSCIDSVSKGSIWAGKQETDLVLEALRGLPEVGLTVQGLWPALTARELNVVQCAARGKTNKAIASELGLSEHTVKNYLFRAFEKLGVSSRVELLFCMTQRGHKFPAFNEVCSDAPVAG
jgi:two-component system nitrate/nitrite response regulator NarL